MNAKRAFPSCSYFQVQSPLFKTIAKSSMVLSAHFISSCAASVPEYDRLIAAGQYVEAKDVIRQTFYEYSLRDWNATMPARRAQLYYWMANAHAKLHDYDSLKLALASCVSSDPGFGKDRERLLTEVAQTEYNKSIASYNAGSFQEAEAGWKTALDLVEPIDSQPFKARIHRNLAYVHMTTADTPQVEYHLKQSALLGDSGSRDDLMSYERQQGPARPTSLQLLNQSVSPSRDQSALQVNGSDAIQFHLVGGYAVSYLQSTSEHSAFRYTADINLNSNNTDGSSRSTSSSYSNDSKHSSTYTTYGVDVAASSVYSIRATEIGSFFFGIGPTIRYSNFRNSRVQTEYPNLPLQTSRVEMSDQTTLWGIGMQGIVGLQASLTPTISCLAEYQLSVLRTWEDNSSTYSTISPSGSNSSGTTGDATGWQISLSSIRLGISISL